MTAKSMEILTNYLENKTLSLGMETHRGVVATQLKVGRTRLKVRKMLFRETKMMFAVTRT